MSSRPEFMFAGVCSQIDPDLWFPDTHDAGYRAKQVCLTACEVQPQCLAWALDTNERHGIWGGYSTRVRDRLKRQRDRDQDAA